MLLVPGAAPLGSGRFTSRFTLQVRLRFELVAGLGGTLVSGWGHTSRRFVFSLVVGSDESPTLC